MRDPETDPEANNLPPESVVLRESDRRILVQKLMHPEWDAAKIAKALGVGRTWVWRRMQSNALRMVFEDINEMILAEAKSNMIAASLLAVSTAVCMMKGQDIDGSIDMTIMPQHKLAAAKMVLESLRGYEGKTGKEGEEEVYEMIVDAVGNIKQQKRVEAPFDRIDPRTVILDEALKSVPVVVEDEEPRSPIENS